MSDIKKQEATDNQSDVNEGKSSTKPVDTSVKDSLMNQKEASREKDTRVGKEYEDAIREQLENKISLVFDEQKRAKAQADQKEKEKKSASKPTPGTPASGKTAITNKKKVASKTGKMAAGTKNGRKGTTTLMTKSNSKAEKTKVMLQTGKAEIDAKMKKTKMKLYLLSSLIPILIGAGILVGVKKLKKKPTPPSEQQESSSNSNSSSSNKRRMKPVMNLADLSSMVQDAEDIQNHTEVYIEIVRFAKANPDSEDIADRLKMDLGESYVDYQLGTDDWTELAEEARQISDNSSMPERMEVIGKLKAFISKNTKEKFAAEYMLVKVSPKQQATATTSEVNDPILEDPMLDDGIDDMLDMTPLE